MAAKKAQTLVVDPGTIDLQGKTKDARLLVAYAAQVGASAVPLVERAFREGSVALRAAAVEVLAEHAPTVGERLVLEAADRVRDGELPAPTPMGALLRSLVVIGSDATIAAAVELALGWRGPALPFDKLLARRPLAGATGRPRPIEAVAGSTNVDALLAALAARLRRLDDNGYRAALFALGLPRALGEADVDRERHRPFVAAILDDERAHPVQREDAARVLLKWRDDRSLALLLERAVLLPIDVALPIFTTRTPAAMFDALAPRVRVDGVFRERVLVMLTADADRRWVDVVRALVELDPPLALDALWRLGDTDTVERLARGPLDDELTKTALHMLASHRHPNAPAIIRAWLEQRPTAPESAAILLAALGACGSLEDAAWLEGRPGDAGAPIPAWRRTAALIRRRVAMTTR